MLPFIRMPSLIQRCHKFLEGKDKPLPFHPTPTAFLFLSCYYYLAPAQERDGATHSLVDKVWVSQADLLYSYHFLKL